MRKFPNLLAVQSYPRKRFSSVSAGLILLFWCFSIGVFQSACASEFASSSSVKQSFNLSYTLIDKSKILSGGPPKDGIPALVNPKVVSAEGAKYLNPSERVIGVEINGEARAYPISIIIWHEAINDTVGGVPILVTYCPLCDSAVVFHRNIDGEVREFGISGFLYQSNVLLYDRRRDSRTESLWSQLEMRAVSGPAARKKLQFNMVDSRLLSANSWIALHPNTTILSIDTGYERPYGQSSYSNYFATDELMFHVSGRTNRRPELTNKDQVLLVTVGDKQKAYVYSDVLRATNQTIEDSIAGTALRIHVDAATRDIHVEAVPEAGAAPNQAVDIKRAYMFWFAFDAFYPYVELYRP